MPATILKANLVRVDPPYDLFGSVEPDRAGAGQGSDLSSQESQILIAETKLMICKLLYDARQQAKQILVDAQQQASQIREKAVADAEVVEKEAKLAGFNTGYQEGQRELDGERRQLQSDQLKQEQQIEQKRLVMIKNLEPSIIQLALQIARKVIHDELKTTPNQVVPIVRAVLSKVVELKDSTLKVSPGDYPAVVDYCNRQNYPDLRVVIDGSLDSGNCLAETPYGVVDGTVDSQVGEIERRFFEVNGNG